MQKISIKCAQENCLVAAKNSQIQEAPALAEEVPMLAAPMQAVPNLAPPVLAAPILAPPVQTAQDGSSPKTCANYNRSLTMLERQFKK